MDKFGTFLKVEKVALLKPFGMLGPGLVFWVPILEAPVATKA